MQASIYNEVYDKDGKRGFEFAPHYGQLQVWNSDKRFIAMIAGTQGGKTSFGPLWLFREICRKGHGDYMVITPTFGLLDLKALPEFLSLFRDNLMLGHYKKGAKTFFFSESAERRIFGKTAEEAGESPTRVIFGYAANPDSLESATAKGVWCDEAGQKMFRLQSWEALQRRLSIHQGRALITTTPYNLGWLKTKIYDPWVKANKDHPDIEVVQFRSDLNPAFPNEEFERAKKELPLWKFKMFYEGQFTRPEGLIYNMFDEITCLVEPFKIPSKWARFVGLDFGSVNMYALFYAMHPDTKELYLYDIYTNRDIPVREHAQAILSRVEGTNFVKAVGGAPSEQQWRDEFRTNGLYIHKPDISDVEVGIDRVVQMHYTNRIKVFKTLEGYVEEKLTYRRALDEQYNPTEKIESKSDFHMMDSERYIISSVDTDMVTKEDIDSLVDLTEPETERY